MTAVHEVCTVCKKDDGTEGALKRLDEMCLLGNRIKGVKAEIEKQQTEVASVKSSLDEEKQTLSEFQGELKELQDELDLLAQGGFGETLRFPKADSTTAATEAGNYEHPAEGPAVEPPGPPDPAPVKPVEDESWRDVPITDLQLKGPDLKPLIEAEHTTLGKLATFTESFVLTDIKGVGEKRAERIEKALEGFWKRRREQQAEVAASAAAPSEPPADEPPSDDSKSGSPQYKTLTAEEVGLSQDELHSISHPHLMPAILNGGVPPIDEYITYEGSAYVLIPAPVERVEAYAMRRLTAVVKDTQFPDQLTLDGAIVRNGDAFFQVGGEDPILLVSR